MQTRVNVFVYLSLKLYTQLTTISHFLLTTSPWKLPFYLLFLWVWWLKILHIGGTIQCLFFWDRLIALSVQFSRLIYVAASDKFLSFWRLTIFHYILFITFIHQWTFGLLPSFGFVNNDAMKVVVELFLCDLAKELFIQGCGWFNLNQNAMEVIAEENSHHLLLYSESLLLH